MFEKIIKKLKFGSCKTTVIDDVKTSKEFEKTNASDEKK